TINPKLIFCIILAKFINFFQFFLLLCILLKFDPICRIATDAELQSKDCNSAFGGAKAAPASF
ncbi:MAG: hypothetical protein FWG12_06615, partial [Holophagaceae bacterium]|nr:hypothetical protein [Holophagaceae bacterium]